MVSPVRLSTVISPTPVTTPPAPARLSPEPPPRHTARPAGGPPGAASLRQTVPSSLGDSGVETRASSQHVANHEPRRARHGGGHEEGRSPGSLLLRCRSSRGGQLIEFRHDARELCDERRHAVALEGLDEQTVVPERSVAATFEALPERLAVHAVVSEDRAGVVELVAG